MQATRLRHVFRTRLWSFNTPAWSTYRRHHSYLSTHSAFPATLYRFQVQRGSTLYDRKFDQDDLEWEDGMEIADDGLVHAKISVDVSNGALFMPNTHYMQKLTRQSFDNYLDGLDNGQPAANPHYLRISKGTEIPSCLTFYREWNARFTLQPSYPMSLSDLNTALTEFYIKHGTAIPPEEWLEKHPYHEAFFDDKEEWMDL